MTAAFPPLRNVFSFQFATFDSCLFIVSLSLHDAGSQLSPIYRGVHLWRPCVLLYILSTLCSSYWVVSYCVKGRGVYFLASLQQPLEERIEIKITGRKASGSIKGCGPEEALASKFMAFWRTQELDGDEEEKNASKARGPRAVRGWGVRWAFGLPEPVWRLLAKSHRGSTGGAHSSKPKPLAAKTGSAPVLLSLAGSSKAFSKSLSFSWSLKYFCWGYFRGALIAGYQYLTNLAWAFFSSLQLRSEMWFQAHLIFVTFCTSTHF